MTIKINYTLKQEGTCLPPEFVADISVEQEGDTLFIAMAEDDGWISVNLRQHTFAVGAYEG